MMRDQEKLALIRDEIDRARRALRGARAFLASAEDDPYGSAAASAAYLWTSDAETITVNTSTTGDNTIITGTPGMVIEVYALLIWNVAAQTLILRDGSSDILPLPGYPAESGLLLPNVGEPWFTLTAGRALVLNLSGATQVTGFVMYRLRTAS